ncbi:MAG: hypothetical protein KGI38_02605 [Thaumarchaeota archaeon]|nr:hypothetical protein [Nitrososphaerota archaeon]
MTVLRVSRFNPSSDPTPWYKEYRIPRALAEQHTVLSLIQYIYDNIDHTLAFRGPCGRGVCGSCTVRMDGRPGLSCMRRADADVTVDPMARFPVLRDLVVDTRPVTKSA